MIAEWMNEQTNPVKYDLEAPSTTGVSLFRHGVKKNKKTIMK